jgi:hypothetical protein
LCRRWIRRFEMAKIEELKEKYKGEWLAIEVIQEKSGRVVEGKLILHTPDREKIWKESPFQKDKVIYVTYAGPPLEEGYAAAF